MSRLNHVDILRNYLNVKRCSIHSAVPYMVTVAPIWPLDDLGSWFFDGFIFEVHLFIMELFFVLSGFLLAMQLAKRSAFEIVIDRIKRIVIPFIFGLIVFVPIILSFFSLKSLVQADSFSVSILLKAYLNGWNLALENFFPTAHLWFINYLILFTLIHVLVELIIRKYIALKIEIYPVYFIVSGVLISVLCMLNMKRWVVDNPLTLLPELPSFIHYYLFFFWGVLLFKHKKFVDFNSIHYRKLLIFGSLIGFGALFPQLLFKQTHLYYYPAIKIIGITFSIGASYLLSAGIWGYFSRIDRKIKPFEQYFTSASFWIYLSNMPFVLFIQFILIPIELPVFVKFLITLFGGIILSILCYEFLVKNTFLGRMLSFSNIKKEKRFW